MYVRKTTRPITPQSDATIEFRASKQTFQKAITFLQQQCDARLSVKEARSWALQIARIFPDSKLATTINDPVRVLTLKQRRLVKRRQALLQQSQQTEMLFLFNFKE